MARRIVVGPRTPIPDPRGAVKQRSGRTTVKLQRGHYTPVATACPCGCMGVGFTLRAKVIEDDDGRGNVSRRSGGRYYTSDSGCGTTMNLDCNLISVPARDDARAVTYSGQPSRPIDVKFNKQCNARRPQARSACHR